MGVLVSVSKKGGPNGSRVAAMELGRSCCHIPSSGCHTVESLLRETLSQVTVGVLLTIHTLQVLLLNQNVDAFLDDWHSRLEAGGQLR